MRNGGRLDDGVRVLLDLEEMMGLIITDEMN